MPASVMRNCSLTEREPFIAREDAQPLSRKLTTRAFTICWLFQIWTVFFTYDLLFATDSIIAVVADALKTVYSIDTLSIQTRFWTAVVNVNITVSSGKSSLTATVVKSIARLAVLEV